MKMKWYQPEYVAIILGLIVLFALSFFAYNALNIKFDKKKAELGNRSSCRTVYWKQKIRNWTDYFWSNSMRFAWITLILISLIAYGIAIDISWNMDQGAYLSIFFSIVTIIFFAFSYISYKNFPIKAKAALEEFENAIKNGIKKEISFEGDSIQKFTKESDTIDANEQIFDFVIGTKKIDFPPFESRAPKKPVIAERKLEFLILSKEYFSICQGATPFNLLDPAKLPDKKKCAPKKAAGPCREYYYSQMKNVSYEGEKITIYFNNGDEAVTYSCPKKLGKHTAVLKALKEKLRITERQRLSKIDEYKKFTDIKKETIKEREVHEDEEEESEE
jgi:transcription elongation factor Elf1